MPIPRLIKRVLVPVILGLSLVLLSRWPLVVSPARAATILANSLAAGLELYVDAPPVAGFMASPQTGWSPLQVSFSNSSLDASSYLWNFGDGDTSVETEPVHLYTQAGVYTVTLTASGPGGSHSLTRTGYINVYPAPQASFSYGPAQVLQEEVDGALVDLLPANLGSLPSQLANFDIHQEGDTYYLYVGSRQIHSQPSTPSIEQRFESQDGLHWRNRTNLNLAISGSYKFMDGMQQIIKTGSQYEGWEEYFYEWTSGWGYSLRYMTSPDGLNWTVANQPALIGVDRSATVIKDGPVYHMWAIPYGDGNYTGSRELRYRTSTSPGSGWGHWQDGGSLVLVDGQGVGLSRVRQLADGSFQLFYLLSGELRLAIGTDGIHFTQVAQLMDYRQVLPITPDDYIFYSFAVVDVDGEDWVYFTYCETVNAANQCQNSRMAVSRPVKPLLGITKSGPAQVAAGQPITYTLTVTNYSPLAAADLVITDTIPAGATYLGGGTRQGNRVEWTAPGLAGGEALSVTFAVTAASTVVNSDYGVTAADGVSAAGHRAVTTHIYQPILAGFSADPLSGKAPLAVTFSNSSSGASTYLWNFGDVGTSVETNPVHLYPQPGTYTVTLKATGPGGSHSLTRTGYINVLDNATPDLSTSRMMTNRSRVRQGDRLIYSVYLYNTSRSPATASLAATLPAFTSYVPGSAMASDGRPVIWTGLGLHWTGQVISGTPVILVYSAEVQEAAPGTDITSVVSLNDGAGQALELSASAVYDPLYGLTINNGQLYTRVPTVTVSLSWGATEPAITTMRLSNDGGFGPGSLTMPAGHQVGWILSTYGSLTLPRSVYAVFFDSSGAAYGPVSDDIIYDPVPPELEVELLRQPAGGQAAVLAGQAWVRVSSRDDNSGLDAVTISDRPDFASPATVTYPISSAVQEWPWTSSGPVYVKVTDRAGNVSAIRSAELDTGSRLYLPFVLKQK